MGGKKKMSDDALVEEVMSDDALVEEACKAYGIDLQYVFASSVKNGEATILTKGGTRVRYKKGDRVERLDPIKVDGVVRKKMKPVTGTKKKR